MALADVYDALASRRIYRERLPHEVIAMQITAASGRHFDPDVVEAFVALQDQFAAIARELADDDDVIS